MYFCPKCSYILDIGKAVPINAGKKGIKTPISNVSGIIKMILGDDNEIDSYKFNIDVNSLEKNSKYKKLSENDRIKVYNKVTENLYLNKASVDQFANFLCKNCGYNKEITASLTLYKKSYKEENDTNQVYDLSTNELLKHDPTLPRTRNYNCKNINCITNDKKNKSVEKEAVFYRSDGFDIKYLCTVCNHSWSN